MADQKQDEFAPRKAVKSQVKLKIGSQGPSGSGKTEGALALARNLKPQGKILVVDTENETSANYSDRYEFDIVPLMSPYTPDRYIKAMMVAIKNGYDFLIVDSATHEWNGEGGIMSQKDALDAKPDSNSFTNWAKLTPQHERFIEFLKQAPIDMIVTMRTKQAYVLELVKGKQKPRKLGMAPIQREGIEYELGLVFDVDMDHKASVSKSRLKDVFEVDEQMDLMDPKLAQRIQDWRMSGAEYVQKPFVAPEAPTPVSENGTRGKKPLLISNDDRLFFWDTAVKSGNTNEQIQIWLQQTLKIDSSKSIPATAFQQIMDWAHKPAEVREFAPGEEKARDAAKMMKLTESEIQEELILAKGDWDKVYASISSAADLDALSTK